MEKAGPDYILYVLNFRYKGGAYQQPRLEAKLNSLGWRKISDLTACYVLKQKEDENIQHDAITRVLQEHVNTDKAENEVRFGISKYIPPNQRPDNYEGIDTLFDEH